MSGSLLSFLLLSQKSQECRDISFPRYFATVCLFSLIIFLDNYCVRPYIVYMLRESEIREDWTAIMLAVKQAEESQRIHDGRNRINVYYCFTSTICIVMFSHFADNYQFIFTTQ